MIGAVGSSTGATSLRLPANRYCPSSRVFRAASTSGSSASTRSVERHLAAETAVEPLHQCRSRTRGDVDDTAQRAVHDLQPLPEPLVLVGQRRLQRPRVLDPDQLAGRSAIWS